MTPCRDCGQQVRAREAYCPFCGSARQAGAPPARFSRWNEGFSAAGVWLAVLLLGLCLSPVLIVFVYLIVLVLPFYVALVLGLAFKAATGAPRACRASGGQILFTAYLGYALLAVLLLAGLWLRTNRLQKEAQELQEVQQQFGPLFYPGSHPDPDFPPAIRTGASLGDVMRFYRGNPACDERKSYGGGGEYSILCRPTNAAAVHIKLSSRVENNEPYVLIQMEP